MLTNPLFLKEVASYLNSGVDVYGNEQGQAEVIEVINKERFVMLKGSFKDEVSEMMYYSEDLCVPKFVLVRNRLGKICSVRMRTYIKKMGRQRIEVFYDEYTIC